jgi:hypothetical protein
VLLAIDLATGAVLLAVDLLVFLPGEFSAVGLAVGVNLLVDALLAVLSAGSLAGMSLSRCGSRWRCGPADFRGAGRPRCCRSAHVLALCLSW